MRSGVRSRAQGGTLAAGQLAVFLLPCALVQLLPNFYYGSLLIVIGADIMQEWLVATRRRIKRAEFALSWLAFLATVALTAMLPVKVRLVPVCCVIFVACLCAAYCELIPCVCACCVLRALCSYLAAIPAVRCALAAPCMRLLCVSCMLEMRCATAPSKLPELDVAGPVNRSTSSDHVTHHACVTTHTCACMSARAVQRPSHLGQLVPPSGG